MRLEEFAKVIGKCAATLAPLGLDLTAIITTGAEEDFNDPIVSVVGITAIQIALVELLRLMEISPQGYVGHSAGEIGEYPRIIQATLILWHLFIPFFTI